MEGGKARDQRPCDNCRRRKIRCLFSSNEVVNCMLCISRSTECTYVQEPARKKRTLSTLVERSQDAESSRVKQRYFHSKIDISVLKDYSAMPGKSLLKETLGHQNRQSSSILGLTSDFDPSILLNHPFNPKGECLSIKTPPILRRASQHTYFRMRPDTPEEMEQELANLDAIEAIVAPHGSELVKLYFRIVHPSFPILHKKVFLEKHNRTYRESTPIGLGAVYLLALNWWSYSPSLSNLPKPNAKELERLVLKSLFQAHTRPKISDLQGGLVLLQRPEVSSWTLTGHLLAMAQNLGIHFDCSNWQIPDWERGVRKRVAWALFMQDKWGALVYGRPSNIKMDDWDVRPLELLDFPETARDDDDEEGSAEIEKGRQTFLQMVALTMIVAEILERFFTLKAMRKERDIHEMLERAKPIQMRLKDWHANLPSALSIRDTTPRRLSSVGYLHLAYYTAEITLHRAILRTYSFSFIPKSLSPSTDTELSVLTRTAALTRFTTALTFLTSLKPEHLQSFWYFSSSLSLAIIGTFASILCVTSSDQEEREAHIARLAEFRWTLRISSTSAEFMKYAVRVLDKVSDLIELGKQQGSDKDSEEYLYPASVRSDEFSPLFADSAPSMGLPDDDESARLDWTRHPFDMDLTTFGEFGIDGEFPFGDVQEKNIAMESVGAIDI
ncbi:transcriptional activator protein DAL81 [Melanomma pulvis-pyrius CBS 109.77]|uniref:Transcriptional activator protein DAL81 n=1 Tax=Melanomma pulvis-pyrius CBS 109.77 TaxID=1314802 RepID=A0A6A6XKD9_9PLEO|nr:transcriptional activator protein DAL81 [Melanomma pulvis-pyrius CBS 109.77]